MGSGKSAVGRKVSHLLGLPFVDTDKVIEEKAGRPIPAIFETDGETAFRDLESEVIAEVAAGPPSVISTGGGALLRPQNVETLKRNGVLIHLEVDAETVLQRTGNRKSRPLLAGAEDPLARIRELMEARKDIYAQADVTLDTVNQSVVQAAEEVVRTWESFCE
jgi:shikimate kinase